MVKQLRLSVSSVTPEQWNFIMKLAEDQEDDEEENGTEENNDNTSESEE